jgi:hypothetical protein
MGGRKRGRKISHTIYPDIRIACTTVKKEFSEKGKKKINTSAKSRELY